MKHTTLLILIIFIFIGCSTKPIGTPCIRKGDGFTARHSCKTLCMSIWRMTCADGSIGNSNVCGGKLNCSRGSCSTGEVCYQTNSDRSVCIPDNICPEWKDIANHPEVKLQAFKKRKNPLKPTATATKLHDR